MIKLIRIPTHRIHGLATLRDRRMGAAPLIAQQREALLTVLSIYAEY